MASKNMRRYRYKHGQENKLYQQPRETKGERRPDRFKVIDPTTREIEKRRMEKLQGVK